MTNVSEYAWVNGGIAPRESGAPSIASISFHLGLGVFDGVMAYWNADHHHLHEAREHLQRFVAGAARMEMAVPWSVDDLLEGTMDLLSTVGPGTSYIRPIAYRRAPELWVTGSKTRPVDVSIFAVRLEGRRELGAPLTCHISSVERISSAAFPAQTKVSGSYVNSFHARNLAERAGFDDAIMLDRHGFVAEASAANVFFISHDRLYTPKMNEEIFPGITRSYIIRLCQHLGVPVEEVPMRVSDLEAFSGAFLCSTLMEIRGISCLGERELGTNKIDLFHDLLNGFAGQIGQL